VYDCLYQFLPLSVDCFSTNIFSMKLTESFGPLIHDHSLIAGGPTVVISNCVYVDCFQLFSILLIHNQLDARSAEWLSFQIAFLLTLRQPFFLQSSMRSVYPHLVSHGTVSSVAMSFFPVLDQSTISGLRVLWTMSGKTSLFPMSTSIFHPVVPSRIDALLFSSSCCGFTRFDE